VRARAAALPRGLFAAMFAVLIGGVIAGLVARGAEAAYDAGAEIVSVDNARDEQADDSVVAASMTPDGRYVVFQTQAENFFADNDPDPPGATRVGGIFRYDRLTGDLQLVADGDIVSNADGSTLVRGASNPSISDDGRYVVFSTGQRLVAGDTNDNVDVYVRDMSIPLAPDRVGSGAYSLVSAKDGGSTAATYSRPDSAPPALTGQRNPGSQVWPGTAISADGRFVAFRTLTWSSDLPNESTPDTPGGQVFVRDLVTHHTSLLTQTSQTTGATALGSPAGGALGPLVISADGSTVSWLGNNAPAQTVFLNGEPLDTQTRFYLLRRWQEPNATTMRITGIADPTNPSCPANGSVGTTIFSTGPCDGPLTGIEAGLNDFSLPAPALSADGTKIAYVATGELRPPQSSFVNPGFDLFYVDLGSAAYQRGGLRASTIELTRAGNNTDSRATPPIDTVSITRNCRYVGITSSRVVFAGGTLDPLGTFRNSSDSEEGYVIDMTARTIDRVVTNANGGDADASIVGPLSLSADASLVAFVSNADNLIFGDANGVADAFVAHRTPVNQQPPPSSTTTSSTFTIKNNQPPPAISVTAKRRTDTSMTLSVRVPGAGGIAAIARRHGHGAPVVARAFSTASKRGTFRVTLPLLPKYATLVRKGQSVSASVTVTWSPKGKGAKKHSVDVTFKRSAKPKRKTRR
jgi:hypothetical protein